MKKYFGFFGAIILTLGLFVVPSFVFAADTGFQYPIVNENSGWDNPQNGYTSDDIRTSANSQDDVVIYSGFNLSIPSGALITGIEVEMEGYTTSLRQADVSLSSGGTNFTTGSGVKTTNALGDTDGIISLGGSNDLWNRSWSAEDFTGFKIKLDATSVGSGPILYVDQVRVKVYYTLPAANLVLTAPSTVTITKSALLDSINGVASDNAAVTTAVSGLDPIQVSLENTGEAASANVRISPIGAGSNIQFWAEDSEHNWYDINITGWGDAGGFSLPAGAKNTTDVFVISDKAGSYPLTINLVDATTPSTAITTVGGIVTVNEPTLTPMSITSSLPTFTAGVEAPFTVSTEANDDAEEMVRAYFTIPEGAYVKYQEQDGNYYPLTDVYGPTTGFPVRDITSNFKATFASAGTYTVKVEFKLVPEGTVIATKDLVATVIPYNTPVLTLNPLSKLVYNGGEKILISWSSENPENFVNNTPVTIGYSPDPSLGQSSWITIAENQLANGSYEWVLPNIDTTKGQIMLMASSVLNQHYYPTSETFSIYKVVPTNKEECKNGHWESFNNPSFPNQGQCVSSVVSNQGGNGGGGGSSSGRRHNTAGIFSSGGEVLGASTIGEGYPTETLVLQQRLLQLMVQLLSVLQQYKSMVS